MNETITLPKLITLVAKAAECTPAEARKFVHDFFALIEQTLSAGEMVTIKGVGTFARTDNPTAPIKFQADDDLAAAVNEPFSAFQAVELNDGVTDEMLQEPTPTQPQPEPQPKPEETPAQSDLSDQSDQSDQSDPEPQPEPEPDPEPDPEPVPEPVPVPEPEPEPEPVPEPEPEPEPQKTTFSVPPLEEDSEELADDAVQPEEATNTNSHRSLWFVLGLLIGLIAGLIGGYIAGRNAVDTSSDDIDRIKAEIDSLNKVGVIDNTATPAQTVTPAEDATQPEAPNTEVPEVYDTVRSGYYLTTMAGKHYGQKNYWVFIYQANPGLGHPNAIGPGTKVKIPPMESFAEPTEEATKAKAQQILNELKNKYKF